MIVAQQMQTAVHRQQRQLMAQAMARLSGLPVRKIRAQHNIAQHRRPWIWRIRTPRPGCQLIHGETHHIRRPLQIQPTNMEIRNGIQIHNVNGQLRIRVHIHTLQGKGRHINQSFLVHAHIGGILQNLSLPLAGSVGIPGLVKHLNAHSRSSHWARLTCSARSCLAIWAVS